MVMTRAVPGGSGGGIPGNGGWTGLAFSLFPGRGLAIHRHAPSLAQSRERTLRATLRPAAPSSSSCAFLPQPLVRHPTHSDSGGGRGRSEEHTSELQSRQYLVCRLLLEKKKNTKDTKYNTCMVNKPRNKTN